MKLQEQYDALDKEILQAVKERKFDLKDEKVKVQKRIAYLLSLEKEIEDSDKKILKGSKEWASNEELEKEVQKQENLKYKLDIAYQREYDRVYDEVNGHRIIEWWEWYWMIDENWEEITKEKYDSFWNLNEYWVAVVKKDWKYWLINESGKLLTPITYDSINEFSEWLAVVRRGNKYWLIDTVGRVILPIKYTDLSKVKNWNLLFRDENLRWYWMINIKWEILHEPEYGYTSELLDNWYAIVHKDGKKWVLNNKWELIVPTKYDYIYSSDFLKWWLIEVHNYPTDWWKVKKWKVTPEGKEIIPPLYEDIKEIWWLEWVYKVKLTSKNNWSYQWLIDKDGNVIVTPDKYYNICDFETKKDWRKFAEVWNWDKNIGREKKWLIDETWKEVIPPFYGELVPLDKHADYYKVSRQMLFWKYKYGYVDLYWNEYFWKKAENLEDELNLK